MANKRSKKRLNSKQANRISLIVSAVYFSCAYVNGIISKPTGDFAGYYWCIGAGVGTALIYFVLYFLIFKGDDKKNEEETEKIKRATMEKLSYTEFKQVYLVFRNSGSAVIMIEQILQKEGCKFYARLNENNNIYLIVKDKHNEEVYSAEIIQYDYFASNFTFK